MNRGRTRRERDPYSWTVVRLPERDLGDSIVDLASPLLESLGPERRPEDTRRAIELAVKIWNAHVLASKFWGRPRPRALADLEKMMSEESDTFALLSARWRKDFAFDPRLVAAWSYETSEHGDHRVVCESTLPDGVEAEVPPPLEKRIALGGVFLDEVRIRQGANAYLSFPVGNHRGTIGADGVATVYAKMPTVSSSQRVGFRRSALGPSRSRSAAARSVQWCCRRSTARVGPGTTTLPVLVFRPAIG